MDYGSIIKRAWKVTWRYKILWLFGLLAGGVYSGNGGSGSGNYSVSSDNYNNLPPEVDRAFERTAWWIQNNIGFIVAIAVVLFLIGVVFWVVSIAARGGLIHLVNEAEENQSVVAGRGWSAGFSHWLDLFLIRFVLFFPFVLLVLVLLTVSIGPLILASISDESAVLPGVLGMCGVLAFGGIVVFVLGAALQLLAHLAERHAVIGGLKAMASISAGWNDLRGRFKNVLLMWLITLAMDFVYSLAVIMLMVVAAIGAVVMLLSAGPFGLVLIVIVFAALMLLPNAIYATFLSALWTIFWRDLTGRGAIPVRLAPSTYAPTSPSEDPALLPPTVPVPPAPPEPPTSPASGT